MGRIVIPRPQQRRREQIRMLPKQQKYGYFSRGFGPQEMQLINRLADLAVAGGGQIARAVQISNREREQEEAQADYDRRLQSEIESRQRAAQAEIADAQLGGGPQAFMSDFFFNRPDVALKPADAPDTSGLRGVTQQRGAPIIAGSGFAPEDARRLAVQAAMGRQPVGPIDSNMDPGGLIEPVGAPSSPLTRDDVLREADAAGINPRSELVREALTRASMQGSEIPTYNQLDELDLQDLALRRQAIEQRRAQALQQAQQAMQGRDFRQEAMEAIGPAPERKLFRIADILAAAPSARTAEQRAMLLQAAVDSPDIQAANLSDLARGAYRDRAMQAVMKLFPEEEEPMSELDMLRMQSMRERMETENLRQQRLQAELDKDAAAAERRANAATKTSPDRAKKEALYAFYTKNWPRKEAMGDEAWSSGAGELADMTPSGLPAWVRNNKLSRGTRKSVNTTVGRLLQMRPKPDPRPPRTTLTPSEQIRLEGTITRLETQEADAMSKVRAFEATLSDTKTLKLAEKRGISKAQIEAAIAGEKEKARIAREGIKTSKARLETKPEAAPAPSGAVYTAPPEGETEQEKFNRLNALLR